MLLQEAAWKWVACIGIAVLGTSGLRAQTMPLPINTEHEASNPNLKLPSYDVASIKPHAGDDRMMRWGVRGDGFTAQNLSLKMMIANCYGIRQDLISGGPAWVDNKRFDMEAKVVDPDPAVMKQLTFDQRRSMLKPLLEERFGLKAHVETKTLPTYDLVVVKEGLKMKEAAPDPPVAPDAKDSEQPKPRGSMVTRPGETDGTDLPISSLVTLLAGTLQRTVIDKTGLTGKYDFVLKYASENMPAGNNDSGAETAPSIFTAIQEQLGLRLVPSKGPVDTLVIDHADLPTEN